MQTIEWGIFLIAGGFIAGLFDALAGGGGLIALPLLLFAGVPPTHALGTNKLQAIVGETTTMFHFIRQGHLKLSAIKWSLVTISIGGLMGALAVQFIHPKHLEKLMPFFMFFILNYVFWLPYFSQLRLKKTLPPLLFAILIGSMIGFYNGFFGPGTGALLIFAFVALQNVSLQEALVCSKPLNVMTNVSALVLFIFNRKVAYLPALLMAAGQILGGYLGARLVIFKGHVFIRPVFLITVSLITAKLFYNAYFQ